ERAVWLDLDASFGQLFHDEVRKMRPLVASNGDFHCTSSVIKIGAPFKETAARNRGWISLLQKPGNPPRRKEADIHGGYAYDVARKNIKERMARLPLPYKVQRFETECGEGRISPERSHHQKQPEVGRDLEAFE